MCGLSAGSLCWFREAVAATTARSTGSRASGFVSHSNAVHYCGVDHRAAFHKHLMDGMCQDSRPRRRGTEVGRRRADQGVSSRLEARAYRLERRASLVRETRLATRYLGANTIPPVLPVSFDGEGPGMT